MKKLLTFLVLFMAGLVALSPAYAQTNQPFDPSQTPGQTDDIAYQGYLYLLAHPGGQTQLVSAQVPVHSSGSVTSPGLPNTGGALGQPFDPSKTPGQTDDLYYQGYLNSLNPNTSSSVVVLPSSQSSGTTGNQPGLPNTGAGGEAALNFAILFTSAFFTVLGFFLLRPAFVQASRKNS